MERIDIGTPTGVKVFTCIIECEEDKRELEICDHTGNLTLDGLVELLKGKSVKPIKQTRTWKIPRIKSVKRKTWTAKEIKYLKSTIEEKGFTRKILRKLKRELKRPETSIYARVAKHTGKHNLEN